MSCSGDVTNDLFHLALSCAPSYMRIATVHCGSAFGPLPATRNWGYLGYEPSKFTLIQRDLRLEKTIFSSSVVPTFDVVFELIHKENSSVGKGAIHTLASNGMSDSWSMKSNES
jgi:hypothetical protein